MGSIDGLITRLVGFGFSLVDLCLELTSGEELEDLVEEDDGEGEEDDQDPVLE